MRSDRPLDEIRLAELLSALPPVPETWIRAAEALAGDNERTVDSDRRHAGQLHGSSQS